jgi:hypothetical protein
VGIGAHRLILAPAPAQPRVFPDNAKNSLTFEHACLKLICPLRSTDRLEGINDISGVRP